MLIYSPRKIPTTSELNFLRLFANQIEFAVIIADLFATVREQSVTDPLTGLYNRRYFDDYNNLDIVAYSPKIDYCLNFDNKQYNVQIAVDKGVVYVGFPTIYGGF